MKDAGALWRGLIARMANVIRVNSGKLKIIHRSGHIALNISISSSNFRFYSLSYIIESRISDLLHTLGRLHSLAELHAVVRLYTLAALDTSATLHILAM